MVPNTDTLRHPFSLSLPIPTSTTEDGDCVDVGVAGLTASSSTEAALSCLAFRSRDANGGLRRQTGGRRGDVMPGRGCS